MDPLKRHTPIKTNRKAENLLDEKSSENRTTISAAHMIK